jgi:hypothetical protein
MTQEKPKQTEGHCWVGSVDTRKSTEQRRGTSGRQVACTGRIGTSRIGSAKYCSPGKEELLTCLITYLLTHSMVQDIIWKADCHSACQKKSCFLYGTRKFATVFTKVRHRTLSRASRIQFASSIPVSLRAILISSSQLRLCLPSGLFPSGLRTETF